MFKFLLSGLLLISINVFAANNDSVFNPNLSAPVGSQTQTNTGTSNGSPIVSVSANEFQYGTCPAGFTYNSSSQFPLQVRTVTTNYSNGLYVGTITSPWYDLDADCQTTEYQQIACPTNYTGVYYQSRTVTTADGGYEYNAWTTYGNNCVYNPPVVRKSGYTPIITANDTSGYFPAIVFINETGAVSCSTGFGFYPVNGNWVVIRNGSLSSSYDIPDVAGCSLNGDKGSVFGNCNSQGGGDTQACYGGSASFVINSRSANNCQIVVTVTVNGNGTQVGTSTYNLCQ